MLLVDSVCMCVVKSTLKKKKTLLCKSSQRIVSNVIWISDNIWVWVKLVHYTCVWYVRMWMDHSTWVVYHNDTLNADAQVQPSHLILSFFLICIKWCLWVASTPCMMQCDVNSRPVARLVPCRRHGNWFYKLMHAEILNFLLFSPFFSL